MKRTAIIEGNELLVYCIHDGPWSAQCDQCGYPLTLGDLVYYDVYLNKYFCSPRCYMDFIGNQH